MKNPVVIKSFPNGITLFLDEEINFEELLLHIAMKFKESSGFFKNAKMALMIRGRQISAEEEMRILDAIKENSELNIMCLVGEEDETDRLFTKALAQTDFSEDSETGSEGQFFKGTLKNGQVLETEKSIVILGDVYPGCAVISSKDIIILGGLYGEAYAGGSGLEGHYVVALEMAPEKLKIGDFTYLTKDKSSKWSIKPKVQPKIAYVKNNTIVTDCLTKELLSELPV